MDRLIPDGLSHAAISFVESLKINSITEKARRDRRVVIKRRNVYGERAADLINFYFRAAGISNSLPERRAGMAAVGNAMFSNAQRRPFSREDQGQSHRNAGKIARRQSVGSHKSGNAHATDVESSRQ
jgi:hypothetical protein